MTAILTNLIKRFILKFRRLIYKMLRYEDLTEFDTGLTADVVEFRPNTTNSNILACGTYFLDTEKNKRQGRIYFLNLVQQEVNFTNNISKASPSAPGI